MSECKLDVKVTTPQINAYTYPSGPKGVGIKEIIQSQNKILFILDDNKERIVEFPNWWFGTAESYNRLSAEDKHKYELYFIEEGS